MRMSVLMVVLMFVVVLGAVPVSAWCVLVRLMARPSPIVRILLAGASCRAPAKRHERFSHDLKGDMADLESVAQLKRRSLEKRIVRMAARHHQMSRQRDIAGAGRPHMQE